MAISRQKKESLVSEYTSAITSAKNVVLIRQSGVSVNDSNNLRMDLDAAGGIFSVIRKRLFLRSLSDAKVEPVGLDQLEGPVVAVYATQDEFAPMKAIQNFIKAGKKADKKFTIEYVGGRFDGQRKDAQYVQTLATLPSKEELVGKLLFLLQHPVQKFVGTLDAIAKK